MRLMKSLELKIPPPLLFAIFAAGMYWVSQYQQYVMQVTGRHIMSLLLVMAGLFFSFSGVYRFVKAKTTINPSRPEQASKLVMDGLYRYTRNPMYVGQVLVIAGWALYLSSFYAILLVPCFAMYLNRFQVMPEERTLESLFGEEYAMYRRQVRRWL